MHSDVFVRFTDPIRPDRLAAELPPGVHPAHALRETSLCRPELMSSVLHAVLESAFVYLIFKEDSRSVRVHVEARGARRHIRELIRKSKRIADSLVTMGRDLGIRLEQVAISLYEGDDFLASAARRSAGDHFRRRFVDTIFGDVMVGFFTFVCAGTVTGQWREGLVVGFASALCFVTWLAIEAHGRSNAYEWEDF